MACAYDRQRGAPKTKPKPPTPPDNKAFAEAMALRGPYRLTCPQARPTIVRAGCACTTWRAVPHSKKLVMAYRWDLTFSHWYSGSIYPAATIREKTATAFHREGSAGPSTAAPSTGAPKTGVSSDGKPSRGSSRPHSRRPGESLDVSDEVISCGTEQTQGVVVFVWRCVTLFD